MIEESFIKLGKNPTSVQINGLVKELIEELHPTINKFAIKLNNNNVGISAFKEECALALGNAVESFISKNDNFNINYFIKTIHNTYLQKFKQQNYHLPKNKFVDFQKIPEISENNNPEDILQLKSKIYDNYKLVLDIITEQYKRIEISGASKTVKHKACMYQAFLLILENHTDDMLNYLINQTSNNKFAIQSAIFQKFSELMIQELPITIKSKEKNITITDCCDPRLKLFTGISEFVSEVDKNLTIYNNTEEVYISKNNVNYGKCFIGLLIDIIDLENNVSIKDKVTHYSFSQIFLKDYLPGRKVKVIHYRIVPHYELQSMVFLQRIKRSICDKINKRKK